MYSQDKLKENSEIEKGLGTTPVPDEPRKPQQPEQEDGKQDEQRRGN